MLVRRTSFQSDSEREVYEKFWRESTERKKINEEIDKTSDILTKFDLILKRDWLGAKIEKELYTQLILFKNRDLDEWLAEDGYIKEVYEALGMEP